MLKSGGNRKNLNMVDFMRLTIFFKYFKCILVI